MLLVSFREMHERRQIKRDFECKMIFICPVKIMNTVDFLFFFKKKKTVLNISSNAKKLCKMSNMDTFQSSASSKIWAFKKHFGHASSKYLDFTLDFYTLGFPAVTEVCLGFYRVFKWIKFLLDCHSFGKNTLKEGSSCREVTHIPALHGCVVDNWL